VASGGFWRILAGQTVPMLHFAIFWQWRPPRDEMTRSNKGMVRDLVSPACVV
jgi:hypothetical protein